MPTDDDDDSRQPGRRAGAPGSDRHRSPARHGPQAGAGGPTAFEIDVLVEAEGWTRAFAGRAARTAAPSPEALVEAAARAALLAAVAPRPAGLAVALADDAAVRDLNARFRGKDRPTNVLSFPDGETDPDGTTALGDVILAFETVADEAEAQGKPLADHLAHLTVHGVLHLLGHDHEEAGEAEAMEALERRILAELGVPDPYGDDGGDGGQRVPERVT